MNDRKIITVILYLVILALVFFWMTRLFSNDITNMPYSQVVELFQSEQVRAFSAQEGRLTMQLRTTDSGSTTLTVPLADVEEFRRELWDLIQEQSASGVLESYDFPPLAETGPYDYVLPLILVGLAVLLVLPHGPPQQRRQPHVQFQPRPGQHRPPGGAEGHL